MRKICSLLVLGFSVVALATESRPATNRPLVNQEGKPFQLHDLKGKHVFLSFIFTRCPHPNMCPLTISQSKNLLNAWRKTKGAPDLHLLFVTLDPRFDSPKVLKKFAKDRGLDLTRFTLATGDPAVLSSMQAEFQILALPDGTTIAHNMTNTLLTPEMTIARSWAENQWKPDDVLKEMLPKSAK